MLHDDHIGDLTIPAGNYRLNLMSAERMTCDQAASSLASFLQDYNGRLPRPWFVDAETGTFLNGSINAGFWIEPVSGTPFKTVLKLPGDGTPCAGTFQVLHDVKIGALNVPKGHYLFVPLAQSNLSCKQVVTLLRRFLAAPQNQLPGRGWWPGRRARSPTAAAARSASGSSRRRRDPAPARRRRAAAHYAGAGCRRNRDGASAAHRHELVDEREHLGVRAVVDAAQRADGQDAGRVLAQVRRERERAAPAASQPRPAPVRLGERDAACGAGALDPRLGRRADHGRRHRIEVLAARWSTVSL